MNRSPHEPRVLLSLLLLGGCRDVEAPAAFAPDLLRVFEEAGPRARIPVLVHGGRAPGAQAFGQLGLGLVQVDLEDARRLAEIEGVHLSPDRPLASLRSSSSGVSLTADADVVRRTIGADLAGVDGEGIVIAVVDSGIRRNHEDLDPDLIIEGVDFTDEENDADASSDPFGHGTAVAGIISGTREGVLGVAPGARLLSARVLDDDGAGTTSDAIAALDWILGSQDETGVRVIHFSVGSPAAESFTTDPLAVAVEQALDAGIVVVAAAGNYGSSDGEEVFGGILSPGTHPGVITVGGTDPSGTVVRSDDSVAAWSSRGPTLFDGNGKPDLVAPGTSLPLLGRSGSAIWTAWPSAHLEEYEGVDLDGAPYLVGSGTSFAAPAVTGAVALVLEANPALGPTQVKAILELTASRVDGDALATGAGVLNAAGAVRLATWLAQDEEDPEDPAPPEAWDLIAGESALWGLGILWDGFASSTRNAGEINTLWGVRAVGLLDGSGIIWDGLVARDLRYMGFMVEGDALLDASQQAWSVSRWADDVEWTGDLRWQGSRTWDDPGRWTAKLVQPGHLTFTNAGGLLASELDATGLTVPISGDVDPTPWEPDWEME